MSFSGLFEYSFTPEQQRLLNMLEELRKCHLAPLEKAIKELHSDINEGLLNDPDWNYRRDWRWEKLMRLDRQYITTSGLINQSKLPIFRMAKFSMIIPKDGGKDE